MENTTHTIVPGNTLCHTQILARIQADMDGELCANVAHNTLTDLMTTFHSGLALPLDNQANQQTFLDDLADTIAELALFHQTLATATASQSALPALETMGRDSEVGKQVLALLRQA